jgi:hypothetical protein
VQFFPSSLVHAKALIGRAVTAISRQSMADRIRLPFFLKIDFIGC